jgi:predicted AlkP superfamily phosphohydrolase/phosphomutase
MKVLVIGLDSAPPKLIFDKFLNELPNIKKLISSGSFGELRSSNPPITIPAWTCFVTGKNPGNLGFFGFRNRKQGTYNETTIANSKQIKVDTIWDILSKNNKKVGLIGVPQTYPPKPVNGFIITCFLTPDINCEYTYPKQLKYEIENLVNEYILDIENFRTEKKDWLLNKIYEMTEKRFKVIKNLLKSKSWDFFMFVEIGLDRLQHGFWKFFDEEH